MDDPQQPTLFDTEFNPNGKFFMLWFDSRDMPLEKRVLEGAAYYHKKYNRTPTVVKVPLADHPTDPYVLAINGIKIQPEKNVLKFHLLIGQD
jgi:hypothetical protein